MRLACDTCGRIGTEDDGIEPGGPCQEPCDGTVRLLARPHPDDDLHVILDALGELLDQIDRGEVTPWDDYDTDDDDIKTNRYGYLMGLNRARDAVERELSRKDGLRFSEEEAL